MHTMSRKAILLHTLHLTRKYTLYIMACTNTQTHSMIGYNVEWYLKELLTFLELVLYLLC